MEPRADVAADRLTQFDQALGEALVTIAHTPQVWRQATTPRAPERPVVGLTLTLRRSGERFLRRCGSRRSGLRP